MCSLAAHTALLTAPTNCPTFGPWHLPCFLLPLEPHTHSCVRLRLAMVPCPVLPLHPIIPLLCLSRGKGHARSAHHPSPDTHGVRHMAVSKDWCKNTISQDGFLALSNNCTSGTYPNYGYGFRSKNIQSTLIHTLETLLTI